MLNNQGWIIYSQLHMSIAINISTFLRPIHHSISPIMQGYKDCLSNIELMYQMLGDGSRIPGLLEASSRVFPRSGTKFRHTWDPLTCQVWWSQIGHRTHILFNGKFRHAGAHYSHMIPLQARLWTGNTHFALPLNLSLPAHRVSSVRHYTSGCRGAHPTRTQQISESILDQYVKAAA